MLDHQTVLNMSRAVALQQASLTIDVSLFAIDRDKPSPPLWKAVIVGAYLMALAVTPGVTRKTI